MNELTGQLLPERYLPTDYDDDNALANGLQGTLFIIVPTDDDDEEDADDRALENLLHRPTMADDGDVPIPRN